MQTNLSHLLTHLRGCCPIPNQVVTHVLEDLLTVVVLVAAGVLVGPLQRQDGASVVVQAADIVTTAVVVLGVKHSKGEGGVIQRTTALPLELRAPTCWRCFCPFAPRPGGCCSPCVHARHKVILCTLQLHVYEPHKHNSIQESSCSNS